MKKLLTIAFAALISGAALSQSMWLVGPTQVAAINGNFTGSLSLFNYADGRMAVLYKFDESDDVYFGLDATFGASKESARSFVIVLNAVTKEGPPAFDHFEAFDFTTKSWIEVGATNSNRDRPSLTANETLLSPSLETARFAHPVTGEVWARAIWISKGSEVVYVDQLALIYYR